MFSRERPVRSNSKPGDTTTRAQPLAEDKQETPEASYGMSSQFGRYHRTFVMSIRVFRSKNQRQTWWVTFVHYIAGRNTPFPCQKTAAGDTSCLLMMLNVFKSTMSNFLPLLMDSWGGRQRFPSSPPLLPLFSILCLWEKLLQVHDTQTLQIMLSVRQTNRADGDYRCIHLRSQVLPWHKASQPLISHHHVPTCYVSSLLLNTLFAFQKCKSSELPFHLGVYESRIYLLSLLNTQGRPDAWGCVDWQMPSGSFTFLMFLKGQWACDRS